MLSFYAGKFPTVEINNTFYQLPKEKTLLDWASKVPEHFSFAIKASQRITHFGRLKPETGELVDYLVNTLSALGPRLGPILFQLPPNMKRDMDRLRPFLERLPKGHRYAMEFRHDSWFDDEMFDALREHDVAFVVSEQEDFSTPVRATASWAYFRPHRLDYDEAGLRAWADRVKSLGKEENHVFFKHDYIPAGGAGPLAVETFVNASRAR